MESQPTRLLMSDESQENVRKWIETVWKAGTLIALALGFWGKSTFATKESLQDERETRVREYYEMIKKMDHWEEQKEANLRVDQKLSDYESRFRIIERVIFAGSGEPIDRKPK